MMIKYKLSEVAKNFGLGNKAISEILGKYLKAPKSNAQALSEEELNVVFESLTQDNQIEDFKAIFDADVKAREEAKAAEKAAAKDAAPQPAEAEKKPEKKAEKAKTAAKEAKKDEPKAEKKSVRDAKASATDNTKA